jgi:hypothetical protein
VNTAIVIAVVALAGSVVTAIVSTFGLPVIQGRRDARKVLDAYAEPLVDAAYELQARLYNILCLQFVDRYVKNNAQDKQDAAIHSTLYVFAQFFGSRELIRGEIQYLRFSRHQRTRRVSQLIWEIGEEFLANSYGPQFMLWRVEQRGLGERMISSANGRMTCLGYAAFLEQRDTMDEWLQPLEHDLENLGDGGRQRLTKVQHLLLELVRELDDKGKRYPFTMNEA